MDFQRIPRRRRRDWARYAQERNALNEGKFESSLFRGEGLEVDLTSQLIGASEELSRRKRETKTRVCSDVGLGVFGCELLL